ncbi:hypothetical protein EDWATA_00640 [Edwardsiella tarda ATCC 23685]|uniref:Uncharacterized protein n=1 Tax=Edwardsiella tarda ATCC 23685 TaxID=500638 RepID=D4F1P7_EDWTA|nr:hypothetical protein EDWATA_00640 [Edwardsiella tarda ATCC 23685]
MVAKADNVSVTDLNPLPASCRLADNDAPHALRKVIMGIEESECTSRIRR